MPREIFPSDNLTTAIYIHIAYYSISHNFATIPVSYSTDLRLHSPVLTAIIGNQKQISR